MSQVSINQLNIYYVAEGDFRPDFSIPFRIKWDLSLPGEECNVWTCTILTGVS